MMPARNDHRRTPAILLAAASCILCFVSSRFTTAANWPAWRGPAGNGVSDDVGVPLKWSVTENVRWRIPLPDRGNSTPIVWGTRVFVTQAIEKQNRRTLMCFDRSNGKLLWQSGATHAEDEPTHPSNPYCAASPVTDGERVIAFFGSAGLCCYDYSGKELWRRELGKIRHMGGSGSSPILHGDLCILNFGPGENAAIVAVNKESGETVWRIETPNAPAQHFSRDSAAPGAPSPPGSGRLLAWAMFTGADWDQDEGITGAEFSGLARRWFEASDTDKSGSVNEESLVRGLNRVVEPPPQYSRQEGPRPEPGPLIAPVLMRAVDANQDGHVSRDEFMDAFARWIQKWDSNKDGTLTPDEFRPGVVNLIAPPVVGGSSHVPEGPDASWSTPIIVRVDGRDALIVSFPGRLAAFDPKTGNELWNVKGLGSHVKTSPVWGDGVLVAMGGGPVAGAMAVRPGGKGAVENTHRLWERSRVRNRIGSGVIHQGYFYSVSEVGIAECFDVQTGRTVWEERLRGSSPGGSTWSSVVRVGDRLYVPTQSGEVFVFHASPKFELLGVNSVGNETINASLAISDGEIFLRTFQHLWCIANQSPSKPE